MSRAARNADRRTPSPARPGQEPADVEVGRLLWLGATIVMVLLLVLAGVYFSLGQLRSPQGNARHSAIATVPPPQLQPQPAADYAAYQTAESSAGDDYAWVDREHGVVRIPIDRAMQLIAHRRSAARRVAP